MKTPSEHLVDIGRSYSGLWREIDAIRASRGQDDIPGWSDSCFLPVGVTSIIVESHKLRGMEPQQGDAHRIAVLSAWRPAQDVYQFEPELYDALTSTEMTRIPTEVLMRLPAWCIYVETPGASWTGPQMSGFWASIQDVDGRRELHLVVNIEEMMFIPVPVSLDCNTVREGFITGVNDALGNRGNVDEASIEQTPHLAVLLDAVTKMISLLLYICSTEPDIRSRAGGSWLPSVSLPKKTKNGWIQLNRSLRPTPAFASWYIFWSILS